MFKVCVCICVHVCTCEYIVCVHVTCTQTMYSHVHTCNMYTHVCIRVSTLHELRTLVVTRPLRQLVMVSILYNYMLQKVCTFLIF